MKHLLILLIASNTFAQNIPIYPGSVGLVRAYSINTSEIVNDWLDQAPGITYAYQYADDFQFTTNVVSGTTSSSEYTITGLSANTTKYFRVQLVVSGYSNSNWSRPTLATTLPVNPVAWYSTLGIVYGVDNDYADATTNLATIKNISINSAPDFDVVSQAGIRQANNFETYTIIDANGAIYNGSSDITLAGDFCIAFSVTPPVQASLATVMSNTDGQSFVTIGTLKNVIQIRCNNTNTNITVPNRVSPYKLNDIVLKRVGSNWSASTDGGYTYGPSIAGSTDNFVVNRLFATSAGTGNSLRSVKMIVFFDDVYSGDELSRFFLINKIPNYWKGEDDEDPTPTIPGGWNSLINGSTSDVVSINDNSSPTWKSIWSKGDYTFIKCTEPNDSPTYSQQLLYVYNHNTGLISDPITLPYYIADTDLHNQSSIFVWDNTIWQVGHSQHYATATSPFTGTLKVRRFADNYDLRSYSQINIDNGTTSWTLMQKNYDQVTSVGSRVVILSQEWAADGLSQPSGLTITYSDDAFNSFEFSKLFSVPEGIWPYPYLIRTENNEVALIVAELNYVPVLFSSMSLLRSSDLKKWFNWDRTWSFNVDPVSPINLTEIISNASVRIADVDKSLQRGNFYIDENNFFYGCYGSGEALGWEFCYATNPGFSHVQIQTPSAQNVVLPPLGGGTNYNRVSPNVFKNDSDPTNMTYTIFMICDPNSDGLYRVGKFTTTDRFATEITFDGYVSTDNTRKHWNIQPDFNYHYNGHAMIMGTSVNSAGTSAVPWFYVVK